MATRQWPEQTGEASHGSRTQTVHSVPTQMQHDGEEQHDANPHGVLRLRGGGNARRVVWQAGTVDNEGMGKKKSKICCIYHKPKAFDESSDESSSGSSSSDGASDSDDSASEAERAQSDSSSDRVRASKALQEKRARAAKRNGKMKSREDVLDKGEAEQGDACRHNHKHAKSRRSARKSGNGARGTRTVTLTEPAQAHHPHNQGPASDQEGNSSQHRQPLPNAYERGTA